jgi:3-phenylpropionate/trans-cinnamate dioxygenase ferredoxin reductase subunit
VTRVARGGTDGAHVVVIGGGQAAAQFIEALRFEGHRGAITLVSDESYLPYQRPPLSKEFLAGERTPEWLQYRPPATYADCRVDVRLGRRAVSIDRASRRLHLDDGSTLDYHRLALATGTRVRRLAVPGAEHPAVRYLRTLDDALAVRERLRGARRVVVIGGGFIGLETAAILAKLGRAVTVLETAPRLLPRAGGDVLGRFLLGAHERAGVRVVLGARVTAIAAHDSTRVGEYARAGRGGALAVKCADGVALDADLVLVGIGIVPNDELAIEAGLACDDGVLVDEHARTSDPAIVAFGDCARAPNAFLGHTVRLETVHNAVEQAKTAAATLVGRDLPYRQVPWVWSDQFGWRVQLVGDCSSADVVLRGDPASGRYTAFHYEGDTLRGACAVNRPADFGAARRLLTLGVALARSNAAAPEFDLTRRAPARARPGFARPWPREQARVAARAAGSAQQSTRPAALEPVAGPASLSPPTSAR